MTSVIIAQDMSPKLPRVGAKKVILKNLNETELFINLAKNRIKLSEEFEAIFSSRFPVDFS